MLALNEDSFKPSIEFPLRMIRLANDGNKKMIRKSSTLSSCCNIPRVKLVRMVKFHLDQLLITLVLNSFNFQNDDNDCKKRKLSEDEQDYDGDETGDLFIKLINFK